MDKGSEGTVPRYLLAGNGAPSPEVEAQLEGAGPLVRIDSIDELVADGGGPREPGWIFLPPTTSPEVLADLLVRIAALPGAWSPVLLTDGDGGLDAIPLSPGYREGLRDVLVRMNEEGAAPGFASFRTCLKELARIRHDMNNPLTAALAEIQLVLMDVEPDSELDGALRTVEAQLHRIRDMIAELTALRPPQG